MDYTKVKIVWFNKNKDFGEGTTEKGSKVFITSKSFNDESDVKKLKPEVEVHCQIYNTRQYGFYAYSSEIKK